MRSKEQRDVGREKKDRREEEETVKGEKKERKGELFTFTKEGYFV